MLRGRAVGGTDGCVDVEGGPKGIEARVGSGASPTVMTRSRPQAEAPYELLRIPSMGGSQESLGLQFPELRDIDISPDGKKLAFSVGDPLLREVWAVENVMLAAPR